LPGSAGAPGHQRLTKIIQKKKPGPIDKISAKKLNDSIEIFIEGVQAKKLSPAK
jgi:hypothetical protein